MVEGEADAAAGEVAPGAGRPGSLCCRVDAFQRTGPSSCMLSSTHIDLHAAFSFNAIAAVRWAWHAHGTELSICHLPLQAVLPTALSSHCSQERGKTRPC